MTPNASGVSTESPKQVMLHVVHGTWPYGLLAHFSRRNRAPTTALPWFHAGSDFCRFFESHGIACRTFVWSGNNSVTSRVEAGIAFADHLTDSVQRAPELKHFVVAHSHGGNVALHGAACAAAKSGTYVEGIATLATPFLHILSRSADDDFDEFLQTTARYAVVVGLLMLALVPLMTVVPGYMLSFAIVLSVLVNPVRYLTEAEQRVRVALDEVTNTVRRTYERRPRPRILILRAPRDEASVVLGIVQFLDLLLGLAWKLVRLPIYAIAMVGARSPTVFAATLLAVCGLASNAFLWPVVGFYQGWTLGELYDFFKELSLPVALGFGIGAAVCLALMLV